MRGNGEEKYIRGEEGRGGHTHTEKAVSDGKGQKSERNTRPAEGTTVKKRMMKEVATQTKNKESSSVQSTVTQTEEMEVRTT